MYDNVLKLYPWPFRLSPVSDRLDNPGRRYSFASRTTGDRGGVVHVIGNWPFIPFEE
jgi:hypothetical protein